MQFNLGSPDEKQLVPTVVISQITRLTYCIRSDTQQSGIQEFYQKKNTFRLIYASNENFQNTVLAQIQDFEAFEMFIKPIVKEC